MSLKHSGIFSIIDDMKETYDEALLYKEAFDKSLVPSCIVGYDGKFKVVNSALCEFFGYSEIELLHLDWPKLTVESFLEMDLKNIKDCLSGKIKSYKMYKEYIGKGGIILPSLLYVSIIHEHSVFFSQIIRMEREN